MLTVVMGGCAYDSSTPSDSEKDDSPVASAAEALVTATATAYNRVVLKWPANTESDIAGYRVYRDGKPLKTITGRTTTYTDTSVVGWATYYYQITAFDIAGNESAPTAAVRVSTPQGPGQVACTANGPLECGSGIGGASGWWCVRRVTPCLRPSIIFCPSVLPATSNGKPLSRTQTIMVDGWCEAAYR